MNNLAHLIVVYVQQIVNQQQIVHQLLQLNASQSVVETLPILQSHTHSFAKMQQIVNNLRDKDLVMSS